MRIRIKTNWSKEEREVSLEDAVSVLAFNSWKIGMQTLLEIENEDFQIDTQQQRIEVIEEVMAFMIQSLDRIVHDSVSDEDRATLISMYAKKIADHVQDNARDFSGPGDYRTPLLINLISALKAMPIQNGMMKNTNRAFQWVSSSVSISLMS